MSSKRFESTVQILLPDLPVDQLITVFYLIENADEQHQSIIANDIIPAHSMQFAIVRDILQCSNIPVGELLIAPAHRIGQIVVIGRRSLFDSFAFQHEITKHRLKKLAERSVTPESMVPCLQFTILARLAPEWNRVGAGLVMGRDFVSHINTQKFRRIVPNMHCTKDGHLYLRMTISLCRFLTIDRAQFGRRSTSPRWCSMLPKLSRGQIVGVRKELPANGQFASYGDLQQYWKQVVILWILYDTLPYFQHGYVLPSTPPAYYFDVIYDKISLEPFIYPQFCVLTAAPLKCSTDNKSLDFTMFSFRQSLTRALPIIFGIPFNTNHVVEQGIMRPICALFWEQLPNGDKETKENRVQCKLHLR